MFTLITHLGFRCEPCALSFLYPSKYKKHLESISHQRRVEESRIWQSTCTSDAERSHEVGLFSLYICVTLYLPI